MSGLRFTLTPKILLQAARAHNRTKWPRFLVEFTLFGGLVGLGVGLFVIGELDLWFAAKMAGFALAWTILLLGWAQLWLIPRRLRKTMSYLDADSFNYEVEWNETEFSIRTGDGQASAKFVQLAGWKQAGPLLLIYRLPDLYSVIPNSAFGDPAQQRNLVDCLRTAGVAEL
jgi:hypothetical protein